MSNVSNKELDEREAYKFKEELRDVCDIELNMVWVWNKLRDLEYYMNYKFTTKDIMKINDKLLNETEQPKTIQKIKERKKLLVKKVKILQDKNFINYSKETDDEIKDLQI